MRCLFVSDLHGHVDRYEKLFAAIEARRPEAVFLGGDLLPNPWAAARAIDPRHRDFLHGFVAPALARLRETLGDAYPEILVILGNDDARAEEISVLGIAAQGLWTYAHERRLPLHEHLVLGYAYVPPTPFLNKDWERYDVSRYVDPGCLSPEEGQRTVPVSAETARHATIAADLEILCHGLDLARAICLFHSPPYRTCLDRAALDGRQIDHVPLDVHVGSIAIQRFIALRQPAITLHGHVHESCRLTGSWRERIGRTHVFGAAHDGPELALVDFDANRPEEAERFLL